MADNSRVLEAEVRNEFGKGAARRTRREGKIPAVLYGHGKDPIHLALPSHDTFLALKDNANALLTLTFDGKKQLALAKEIQVHPVSRDIRHIDFVLVRRGEKVLVEVPVVLVGESAPGTIHSLEQQHVTLKVDATAIPEHIEGSIEGLEDGESLHAAKLVIPAGAELETDEEAVIAVVSIPRGEDEETEAAEGEEAEGEEADTEE